MAPYRGRFAPTPSGALHFGSLVAAVGSYLDAREHGGRWLVRIEDPDRPRVVPGAADAILHTLEAFGFEWDGPVMWQSARGEAYAGALQKLRSLGLAYPCTCSRAGCAGGCREGRLECDAPPSWRVRTAGEVVSWADRLCGPQRGKVPEFVVRRADGIFSYQLAVVVDDADQRITDVVRGADLMDSTPRQIWLQQALGFNVPRYMHLPVVRNELGEKLSKQTHAPAISSEGSPAELKAAFDFLGYSAPESLRTVAELWDWALRP